jgi:hypothetical protein
MEWIWVAPLHMGSVNGLDGSLCDGRNGSQMNGMDMRSQMNGMDRSQKNGSNGGQMYGREWYISICC